MKIIYFIIFIFIFYCKSEKINFISEHNENEIIKKFSPIVYLHKDEKYFPSSIEWILENGINYKSHLEIYRDFVNDSISNIYVNYNTDIYIGQKYTADVPCYAYLSYKFNKIYIRYIFTYAYNGEYNILNLFKIGGHEGDIEYIILELNTKTMKPLRVFLSAHTYKEGKWVDIKKMDFDENKIILYAALNGHGLYEKEGVAIRYLGFGNDYTNKGRRWEPLPIRIYNFYQEGFNPYSMGFFSYNNVFFNKKIILGGEDGTSMHDLTLIIKNNINQNFPNVYTYDEYQQLIWMKIILASFFVEIFFISYYFLAVYCLVCFNKFNFNKQM